MTISLKCFGLASLVFSALAARPLEAAQMMGAQVESLQRTGYGMYIVRMKPSSHPGTISSFFLFHSDTLWPKSWAELDIEFTPGYQTRNDHARRFVLDHDNGKAPSICYDAEGKYDTEFFRQHCDVVGTESGQLDIARYRNEDGAVVNRSLSFNTFGNTPLTINQSATTKPPVTQLPGDQQIFYNPPAHIDPYSDFYNYYIWYTPTGVFWSGAVPESDTNFPGSGEVPDSQALPEPVLAKLWNSNTNTGVLPGSRFAVPNGVDFKNSAQKEALAYAADQFTPTDRATGAILDSGRQLAMTFNLWDGSQTTPSLSPQPWGGYQPPNKPAEAVYQKIAFFPLKDLRPEAKLKRFPGPKDYNYDHTTHYSDFTTRTGQFILNGKKASFDQLWMTTDGAFAPLGMLSGYSVFCYPKAPLRAGVGAAPATVNEKGIHLQLRHSGDYAIPSVGQQEDQNTNFTNCLWSDTRGTL